MNSQTAVEFMILERLSVCSMQEDELKNETLGELFHTLSQNIGFKEALSAPSLSTIVTKQGTVFAEKLLLAIVTHCWPQNITRISWFEKQLFVRYLLKCHPAESAKDVLLAGIYAEHYRVRKSTTAGYLIELFSQYMNARAGYIERFYERKKKKHNQETDDTVHHLLGQCPKLLPLVERFIETHSPGFKPLERP